MKLNLGSGSRYKENYINIDRSDERKIDLVADITTLSYPDESIEEVYCRQLIMYFDPEKMHELLYTWQKWLISNGILHIEVANLQLVCQNILDAIAMDSHSMLNGPFGIGQLFGIENTKGHKWAWTPMNLSYLVNEVGFKNIKILQGSLEPTRDFILTAVK